MLIANQKKQENIAEYILYMWQLEDLMRSIDLNPENITALMAQYEGQSEEVLKQIEAWYLKFIRDMKSEKITKTGHLVEVQSVLVELYYLHNTLLNIINDEVYAEVYNEAKPNLEDFKKKYGKPINNEVELCFNALYGWLLLRMQQKTISPETQEAMQSISRLTGYLAAKYKQMKSGKLDFSSN